MRKYEVITIILVTIIAAFGLYRYENQSSSLGIGNMSDDGSGMQLIAFAIGSPPDFAKINNVTEKKRAFFEYLKPGIALENQRIEKERRRLDTMKQRFDNGELSAEDKSYAKRLGKLYNVNVPASGITEGWLDKMLHRVDVLPEALVLIQAANESAWGTSRFATQGNNFFGQWCYQKGCGLVPLQRGGGKSHEVAKFSSVQESIHRYFMNVNRNTAYYQLREIRYQRHLKHESLKDDAAAISLTNGLTKYSERGEAYVKDLQQMIRQNEAYWK